MHEGMGREVVATLPEIRGAMLERNERGANQGRRADAGSNVLMARSASTR